MDTLSDMTVTLPETHTVTPAQTKPIGSTKGEKKYQNPNVTPTPTKDRQTPGHRHFFYSQPNIYAISVL